MSDRFEGAVRNASGRVQETAGELVGDARTQATALLGLLRDEAKVL